MVPEHLTALSPLSFLTRSAFTYGDRAAVVDRRIDLTYGGLYERAQRLAGALHERGIQPGERVAILSPNTHVLLEGHFGVPASEGVLVAMNTRLAPREFAYILEHSESRILIYDQSLREAAQTAAELADVDLELIEAGSDESEYERALTSAQPYWKTPVAETDLLSVNYTSGTTGQPKGVMYHHRGAYLQALAMAFHARLGLDSTYLWTLPMFHTNGWCFPWAVTAAGARHRTLDRIDPGEIWQAIREERVTHLCAAPTVLGMLVEHKAAADGAPLTIHAMTGGSPPTPTLIEKLSSLNINVVHLYGLTETFGPAAICDWRPEWNDLPNDDQAKLKARQGVGNIISDQLRVVDHQGVDVPADGQTIGEIAIKGNNVMLGYFKDPRATAEAIPDGWFRSGDLAVMHEDGYVEIKDRKKDIIIVGGENVSSVEVERALATHPSVFEAAVIAQSDPKWGEKPVAVVELKDGAIATEEDLVDHVRSLLAHFKAPQRVYFQALPRTSTGKILKHELRDQLGQ